MSNKMSEILKSPNNPKSRAFGSVIKRTTIKDQNPSNNLELRNTKRFLSLENNKELIKLISETFEDFLRKYKSPNTEHFLYVSQIVALAKGNSSHILLDMNHFNEYRNEEWNELKECICGNQFETLTIMEETLKELVIECFKRGIEDNQNMNGGNNQNNNIENVQYEALKEVQGKNQQIEFAPIEPLLSIRDIRINDHHKKLISVSGTVTKCTDVRPELKIAVFNCLKCNALTEVHQQFSYVTPKKCSGDKCDNKSDFELNETQSTFVDWQKLKIQENANEIPPGAMPRSIDLIVRNFAVDLLKPGDKIVMTGTLNVIPEASKLIKPGLKIFAEKSNDDRARFENQNKVRGLKDLGVKELTQKIGLMSQSVKRIQSLHIPKQIMNTNLSIDQNIFNSLNDQQKSVYQTIKGWVNSDSTLDNLSKYVAPHIQGQDDIKKGILLQLVGGSPKNAQGSKIRGDLNLCIVGDPGTSKSNFLKWVNKFIPESIQTCGKTASGAGLTAAVTKDPDTGEFTIEAGALMLADNSICCLDEFDKMNDQDVVAIHEAMEQQTISINKAGIHCTLNARSSVLAACNPKMGRQDKSKSLRFNLFMTDAIMSRFDLFFIVTDDVDLEQDDRIARHILNVHTNMGNVEMAQNLMETDELLRTSIEISKMVQPRMTPEAARMMSDCYVQMRGNDADAGHRKAYHVTVRQLESLIRLSEARARLDLSPIITPSHVRDAMTLINKTISDLALPEIEIDITEQHTADDEGYEPKIKFSQDKQVQYVTHILRIAYEYGTVKVNELTESSLTQFSDMGYINAAQRPYYASIIKFIIKRLQSVDRLLLIEIDNTEQDEISVSCHPEYNVQEGVKRVVI